MVICWIAGYKCAAFLSHSLLGQEFVAAMSRNSVGVSSAFCVFSCRTVLWRGQPKHGCFGQFGIRYVLKEQAN